MVTKCLWRRKVMQENITKLTIWRLKKWNVLCSSNFMNIFNKCYCVTTLSNEIILIGYSGSQKYRILPLHSQIPREDQHKVFEDVPPGVTKVCSDYFIPYLYGSFLTSWWYLQHDALVHKSIIIDINYNFDTLTIYMWT